MKVECVSNSLESLPKVFHRADLGFKAQTRFALVPGKAYTVYAMTIYLGGLWYYLCDEDYTYYPVWNPSPLFSITDGRLSAYWRVGLRPVRDPDKSSVPVIAFPEWADDPLYYDRLTDEETNAVALFRKYKALMDEEFA